MSLPNANVVLYDNVRDINGTKDAWTIKVKTLLLWKQTFKDNPKKISSMEMILIDEEGTKIQATVRRNLLVDFESLFEEGCIREISNFQIGSNSGNYMLVKHTSKINFVKATNVRVVDDFVPTDSFQIYDFPTTIDLQLKNIDMRVAFDIVGQVVENDGMVVKYENGKETRVMNFKIQDLSGDKIPCALWGEYALKLHTYISENPNATPVIMLMVNAKLKEWIGKSQVSNCLFGTRLYINDDIQPISDFKKRLLAIDVGESSSSRLTPLSSNMVVTQEEDYYLKFLIRNIDDIPDIKIPETGLSIIATILSFQHDEGWYYFACGDCGIKVIKTKGSESYVCDDCGPVSDVSGKVRVVIRVQDATGTSSFVLFERHIVQTINRSAAFLLEKIHKDEGRQIFPDEFNKLLNRKFLFKIQVSSFNLKREYESYTVHKLTDDEHVMDVVFKHSSTYKEQNALDDGTPENDANKKKAIVSETGDNIVVDLESDTPSSGLGKRTLEIEGNSNDFANSSSKSIKGVGALKIPKMEKLE